MKELRRCCKREQSKEVAVIWFVSLVSGGGVDSVMDQLPNFKDEVTDTNIPKVLGLCEI